MIPLTILKDSIPCVRLQERSKTPIDQWKSNPDHSRHLAASVEIQSHVARGGNYALITGKTFDENHLIVFDCDDFAFAAHAVTNLPPTFYTRTGRGIHFYYYLHPTIQTGDEKTELFFEGKKRGDLLIKNRLVVGAGSTHTNGSKYRACEPRRPITILQQTEWEKILSTYTKQQTTRTLPAKEHSFKTHRVKNQFEIISFARSNGINVAADMAICPFHADNNPSLSFRPREKQLFHCFGCGTSGDVIEFARKLAELGREVRFASN